MNSDDAHSFCTGPVDRIGSFMTPPAVGVTQGELARRRAQADANGGVLRVDSFSRYVVSLHRTCAPRRMG
jgi:hypothetical protein